VLQGDNNVCNTFYRKQIFDSRVFVFIELFCRKSLSDLKWLACHQVKFYFTLRRMWIPHRDWNLGGLQHTLTNRNFQHCTALTPTCENLEDGGCSCCMLLLMEEGWDTG